MTPRRNEGCWLNRGTRRGPPFPGPTRAGWTPAGPGPSSRWAARRRRRQRRGSSSSRRTEPGTPTIPASPFLDKATQMHNHVFLFFLELGTWFSAQSVKDVLTCATNGVIRAPTLAIPLLVPRPKALVAVGYTCRDSDQQRWAFPICTVACILSGSLTSGV